MQLSHFPQRERIILLMTAELVLILAFYVLALKPMLKKVDALNVEIAAQELLRQKSLRIIGQESRVSNQYQKYADLVKLKASEEQEMAKMLAEIEGAAKEIQIRILDMKPQKIKTIDFYRNFGVDLIIEGPLKDITHFLYDLQNLPHLIKVDRLHLEKESVVQPVLKASLTVSKSLIP
jgi:Tfp pilus assembly protein PilO